METFLVNCDACVQTLATIFPQRSRKVLTNLSMKMKHRLVQGKRPFNQEILLQRCVDILTQYEDDQACSAYLLSLGTNKVPGQIPALINQNLEMNEAPGHSNAAVNLDALLDDHADNDMDISIDQTIINVVENFLENDLEDIINIPHPQVPAPVTNNKFENELDQLTSIFPDSDPLFLADQLRNSNSLNELVQRLLAQPHTIRKRSRVKDASDECWDPLVDKINYCGNELPFPKEKASLWNSWEEIDSAPYMDLQRMLDLPPEHELKSEAYRDSVVQMLISRYRKFHQNWLKKIAVECEYSFALIITVLDQAVSQILGPHPKIESLNNKMTYSFDITVANVHIMKNGIRLLKSMRSNSAIHLLAVPLAIQKQLQYLDVLTLRPSLYAEHEKKMEMAKEAGELFECPICCDLLVFESVAQCVDGHLCCPKCLSCQMQEAVYGHLNLIDGRLPCVGDCKSYFSHDTVQHFLGVKALQAMQRRLQEVELGFADLPNFIRCRTCGFGAIVETPVEVDKIFRCEKCRTQWCRICEKIWDSEHFGKSCKEIESDEATVLRVKFEEQMSETVIRKCAKCKQALVKEAGCNKMTCQCGATLCYLCRTPNIDYNHFCRHPLDPDTNCAQCSKCMLFEKAEINDDKRLREIQSEGISESERITGIKRPIGVLDSANGQPTFKKPKPANS